MDILEVYAAGQDISTSQLVKQFLDNYNLKFESLELLVDIAILSMTTISYALIKRSDLVTTIDLKML